MRFNPKYIQLIGDSAIPLLGFFYWNWNLYFILIFYFLDLFIKEVLLHLKSIKIRVFRKEQNAIGLNQEISSWTKYSLISFLLLVFCILLIQLSMPFIQKDFNTLNQLYKFWTYKDVGGMEQGYFLIPLIIFMGFTQYKMEFLKTHAYTNFTIADLWNPHLKSVLILFSFVALSYGIVQFIAIPEFIFVLGIVIISSCYQILTLRNK